MIQAWRLCRQVHSDLSGEGARLLGGRWNSPGRPVVYFAENPALALLEVRVHLDLPADLLPDDYVLIQVALPDASLQEIDGMPEYPRLVGNAWLQAGASAVLRVPSAIVPHSSNLLLNPRHARAAEARIEAMSPFSFDPRLWRPS